MFFLSFTNIDMLVVVSVGVHVLLDSSFHLEDLVISAEFILVMLGVLGCISAFCSSAYGRLRNVKRRNKPGMSSTYSA